MTTFHPPRTRDPVVADTAWQVALDALPWSMAVLDSRGTIVVVNDAWRRAARRHPIRPADDGVGQAYLEFCVTTRGVSLEDANAIAEALRDLLADSSTEYVFEYPGRDPDRWLVVRLRACLVAGRHMVTVVHQDVTDKRRVEEVRRAAARRELEALVDARTREVSRANQELRDAEQELRQSETRFKAAASATADLILEADVQAKTLTWFGGDVDKRFGYEPGQFPRRIDGILELIHPDDRRAVVDHVRRAIDTGETYQLECRVQCQDGSYRHWESSGRVISSERGRPRLVIGAQRDITERKRAETRLRASEQRFRTVADTTTDLVFEAQIEEDVMEWHGDIDGLLAYKSRGFPRTVSAWLDAIHDDDVDEVERRMMVALESGQFDAKYRIRGSDDVFRDWEARGRAFLGPGNKRMIIGAVSDVTEREAMAQSRQEAQHKLRELTTRLFTAQEDERRRLALEFHDGFGQQIAAVSIQLGSLRQNESIPLAVRRELAQIQESVVELSNDFRRVSHQLHPAALEQLGLEAALRAHCASLGTHEQIALKFESHGCSQPLPRDIAICIFRLAQTALSNVIRHSGASEASVRLVGVRDTDGSPGLELTVADNGVGFDVDEAKRKGGLGLVGMEERVRPLGGTLRISSEVGVGTEVEALVPVTRSDGIQHATS